jgi:MoaA/NifB/PqqE/SkfB family radical SAM enzyme
VFVTYVPVRVDLELTYKCSLKCKHCYISKNNSPYLYLDIKYAKELLRDLQEMGTVGLQLLGGEPSLYLDIAEIIKTAKSYDLKIKLASNGSKSLIKNCLLVSDLINCLYISIDGVQHTIDREVLKDPLNQRLIVLKCFPKRCKNKSGLYFE